MPYCTQCGHGVQDADVYCHKCGTRQPGAAPPGDRLSEMLGSLSPRTASLLCYIPMVGWIAAIVMLAASRFRENRTVRFHAFQGIYLFVAWLIVDNVFPDKIGHFPFGHLLSAAILGVWIFMIVKVTQDQVFRLPILGDLADRSVSEQR